MKTLTALLFFLSTYAYSQSALVQQESQNILGVWVIDNQATNKWIFNSNHSCKWELDGGTLAIFSYSITSEFSSNGVEHTYLKLFNSNETYEYEINSISGNKMTLETFEPKVSYIHFTKQ